MNKEDFGQNGPKTSKCDKSIYSREAALTGKMKMEEQTKKGLQGARNLAVGPP